MSDDIQKSNSGKSARGRSPSFPFIALKAAIERLIAFEEHYKRAPASVETIGAVWGMKVGSGNVAQTLSALKSFDLLETQRGGSGTEVTISDDGRTYLRAQQENIRREIIKRIALHPKQIRSHWDQWGTDRPKDAACLDDLVLKEGFTPDGAATFLRVYDGTIAYAGLVETGKSSDVSKTRIEGNDRDQPGGDIPSHLRKPCIEDVVKVGDYIQWTSGGVDQLAPPGRVTWVDEDGGHLRVHGSLTGIPMNEVTVVAAPKVPPASQQTPGASSACAGSDGDVNVLLTGGRLQITADVDLAGLKRLHEILGHYESILKLLEPPNRPSA